MRMAVGACALAVALCLAIFGGGLAQKSSAPGPATAPGGATPAGARPGPVVADVTSSRAVPTPTLAQASPAAPPAAEAAAPAPLPVAAPTCAGNADALGLARVVEIDTTGGPGFGFEHFKSHDFLRDGEVVLTFDDGP